MNDLLSMPTTMTFIKTAESIDKRHADVTMDIRNEWRPSRQQGGGGANSLEPFVWKPRS